LQLVGQCDRAAATEQEAPSSKARRPLEPFFLKRADRYILEHLSTRLKVSQIAAQCNVSCRTLEAAFREYRGITPVAHVRNMRLDSAQSALDTDCEAVSAVAARFGFRSVTTFAVEYRKRFGRRPSDRRTEYK